jgi:predicted outer membrane repeat protein
MLALAVLAAPVGATQPECRVENLTQHTSYNSNNYVDPLGTAIQEAAAGDTLMVIGTSHLQWPAADIRKDLTLRGRPSERHQDTIDGDWWPGTISVKDGAHVTISDLKITGGRYGTIDASFNSELRIKNSFVGGGGSWYHLGILGFYSTVHIENVTISDNPNVGVWNLGGTMTIRDSLISGNTTAGDGGGIHNGRGTEGGTLTIQNSTISGNSAANNGGGIYNAGTLTLINSTVSGNSAGLSGGGIWNDVGSTLALDESSTVSSNTPDDIYPPPA